MASGVYCAAMDTAPPDPGLAVDPAAAGRHFGAGGGVPDLTGALCGMLADLAGYHLRMVKLTTEQAEKAGHLGHEEAVVLEIVSRSTRRTLALMARLHAESKKTPEQLAAERAQRAAAAERALLREKKAKVERSAAAVVGREAGPSDRENLLSDLHERLLYPDIDIALLQEDVSAVVLRVLKDLKITPQQETWSDALMAYEFSAANADLARVEAERAAGQAAAAAGVDWREGVEFSAPPDVETTIGRFTFAPGGALVREGPRERPDAEWPPDILGGRPLPDLLRGRKPPDSG
jgi:hypothetical protein